MDSVGAHASLCRKNLRARETAAEYVLSCFARSLSSRIAQLGTNSLTLPPRRVLTMSSRLSYLHVKLKSTCARQPSRSSLCSGCALHLSHGVYEVAIQEHLNECVGCYPLRRRQCWLLINAARSRTLNGSRKPKCSLKYRTTRFEALSFFLRISRSYQAQVEAVCPFRARRPMEMRSALNQSHRL